MAIPTPVFRYSSAFETTQSGAFSLTVPPVGAGNFVFIVIQTGTASASPTVTDDKGNTWTQIIALTTGVNQHVWIYGLTNATAGITKVSVSFVTNDTFEQVEYQEWCNISTAAMASALDGTPVGAGSVSGATVAAGTITTTAANSLVFQYITNDGSATPNTSYTKGSGFTLLTANTQTGQSTISPLFCTVATQYQVKATAGAINPSMTLVGGTTLVSDTVAFAIKSAAAGTPPPSSGVYVAGVQKAPLTSGLSTATFQFPHIGNLIVAETTHDHAISTITDGDGNTWDHTHSFTTGTQLIIGMSYVKGATPNTDLTGIDITWTGALGGGALGFAVLYDIVGADATAPLAAFTTNSGTQSVNANLTIFPALAPASTNEVITIASLITSNTASDLVAPTPTNGGRSILFDFPGAAGGGTGAEDDDFHGFWMNGSTTTGTAITLSIQNNTSGVGLWTATASEWKAAAAGGSGPVGSQRIDPARVPPVYPDRSYVQSQLSFRLGLSTAFMPERTGRQMLDAAKTLPPQFAFNSSYVQSAINFKLSTAFMPERTGRQMSDAARLPATPPPDRSYVQVALTFWAAVNATPPGGQEISPARVPPYQVPDFNPPNIPIAAFAATHALIPRSPLFTAPRIEMRPLAHVNQPNIAILTPTAALPPSVQEVSPARLLAPPLDRSWVQSISRPMQQSIALPVGQQTFDPARLQAIQLSDRSYVQAALTFNPAANVIPVGKQMLDPAKTILAWDRSYVQVALTFKTTVSVFPAGAQMVDAAKVPLIYPDRSLVQAALTFNPIANRMPVGAQALDPARVPLIYPDRSLVQAALTFNPIANPMPVGDQMLDAARVPLIYPDRSWVRPAFVLALAPPVIPPGAQMLDAARVPLVYPDRSLVQAALTFNPIANRMPVGAQMIDPARFLVQADRSWIVRSLLPAGRPFVPLVWPAPPQPVERDRSWVWPAILQPAILQPATPFRQTDWPTIRPLDARDRSHVQGPIPSTLIAPFLQTDWPSPVFPSYVDRSWTWNGTLWLLLTPAIVVVTPSDVAKFVVTPSDAAKFVATPELSDFTNLGIEP